MMTKKVFSSWWKRVFIAWMLLSILPGCSGLSFGPAAEPVTLRFIYISRSADYEQLAKEFNRLHPNITIQLDPVAPDRNVQQGLASRIEGADAIRVPISAMPEEALSAFMPLDLQISTAKDFPYNDLFPGALEGLKMDGKQMGIPAGINPFVVFYSPKKFASFGVQPPAPNWTMEEFVDTAKAMTHSDDALIGTDQYAFGFCSYPTFTDIAVFTYLFGGGLFDSLTAVSRPTLNERANVEALTWYASLKTDLKVIPSQDNPRGVGELIYRSNCGLWIDWLDRSTLGPIGPDDSTPLPLPTYNKPFNIALLDGYYIFAKSDHPQEAWQWISFLMGQQAASGYLIPPLRSEIDSDAYAARVSKAMVSVARSLPSQVAVLGLEIFRNERLGSVLGLFGQATEQVFKGEKDPQSALDDAQKQAEAMFK